LGLIWAFGSVSRLAYIFYPTLLLFGPLDLFLRLSHMRWEAQIHLISTTPYFNRLISSRFTRAHQYPCYCDLLTLRSMEAPRFVLVASPATKAIIFRSDNSSRVVTPWRVFLSCPINDPYGKLYYALEPDELIWYQSVPSLKSHEFNTIEYLF
jgi:hypothetical protein